MLLYVFVSSLLLQLFCVFALPNDSSDDRILRLETIVKEQSSQIAFLMNDRNIQKSEIQELKWQLEKCESCTKSHKRVPALQMVNGDVLNGRKLHGKRTSQIRSFVIPEMKKAKQTQFEKREFQKMRRQTPDRTVTAFYAYMSKTEVGPGHNHVIVFDHVETNTGNGFNQQTGIFVAPVEGFYTFSYTIVVERGNILSVEFSKNSQIIGSTAADSRSDNPYSSASNTIVVHLNKDDSCVLRTSSNPSYIVDNIYSSEWSRTSFSGWLL